MISVIIPTYNRVQLIDACLDRLAPAVQLLPTQEYEIIVTDDSNDNATNQIIKQKYPWVKWVQGPRRGPAANRNNGARNATGDWLIFLDDDCVPSEQILQAYLAAFEQSKECLAFEGRIYVTSKPRSLLDHAPVNESGGCFWSCNMAIKKEFFFDIGLFDENFPYASMEDVDLFYRIRNNTNRFQFIYAAEVLHPWRRIGNIVKSAHQHFDSLVYYIKKHPEEAKRLNTKTHLLGFLKSRPHQIRQMINCNFNGFWQKLYVDIIWIYLILNLDKEVKKP